MYCDGIIEYFFLTYKDENYEWKDILNYEKFAH